MDEQKTPVERACSLVGTQADLARFFKLTPATVNQWLNDKRPIPPDRCAELEREIKAVVTVEEMRPDLNWVRVKDKTWPHPKGRPLVDVAAEKASV